MVVIFFFLCLFLLKNPYFCQRVVGLSTNGIKTMKLYRYRYKILAIIILLSSLLSTNGIQAKTCAPNLSDVSGSNIIFDNIGDNFNWGKKLKEINSWLPFSKCFEKIKIMTTTIDDLNRRKIPIVKIDNSLKEFINKPLFQDKVEKANETLRKVGLPKKAVVNTSV